MPPVMICTPPLGQPPSWPLPSTAVVWSPAGPGLLDPGQQIPEGSVGNDRGGGYRSLGDVSPIP
eukprot:6408405-Pyramimonas_sp.AAC.1